MELMEGSSSCVSVNEPGEALVWVSDQFLEMVGYDREELIGRPCSFVGGDKTTKENRREVRWLADAKQESLLSLNNYTKQGQEFLNALYICPLYRDGQCRFLLGSQIDIRGRVPPSISSDANPSESMLEVGIGGVTTLANQGQFPFDNEWVQGSISVSTKTDPLDPRSAALFEGSKSSRRLVVQIDIEFKKVPKEADWYLAVEVPGAVSLNVGLKVVSKFVLGVIKLWERTIGYSFGTASSNAFISSKLGNWVDLDGPVVPGRKYKWETYSSFIDLEQWSVVEVPRGRKIEFNQFIGERPLRMVLFAQQGTAGAWTRALEADLTWRGH